jgi:hypothetical protein
MLVTPFVQDEANARYATISERSRGEYDRVLFVYRWLLTSALAGNFEDHSTNAD